MKITNGSSNHNIAFHFCLSLHIPFSKFLSCIILFVPSCQLLLGLPGFFLPGGFQFVTCFGIRVSGILLHMSIPYELSVLYFIHYHMRYLHHFLDSLICYSFKLSLPLRQKSISVVSNIQFVVSLIGHISQLHVIILLLVLYINF